MRRLELAPQAADDITGILNWSAATFGAVAERRYDALIRQAILDLQVDVSRPGVNPLPEYGENVFYYRLELSRRNISKSVGRVRSSRHLIVFRILSDDVIEIGRILHDRMQWKSNIPEEFRGDSSASTP